MEHFVNPKVDKLSNVEISRYSRQMILPEFGKNGQLNLKRGAVLIVGVGGLGCPAAMYLVSAGIGTLGLVDYDVVELNNLHRQVAHSEKTINVSKAESAKQFLSNLNSEVNIRIFPEPFTKDNALPIIQQFDLVLDCTDNAPTRYLLNDACVIGTRSLISGSALRFEGQLVTYNYDGGPCYRCLFPVPPAPEFVTNCSDGGVLGAVPGVIGTLQALEAIKIITGIGPSYVGKMLLFDGLRGCFTEIRLRQKQSKCSVCSLNPTILNLEDGDYEVFCGASFNDKDKPVELLAQNERVSAVEYAKILQNEKDSSEDSHVLLDVREKQEMHICALPKAKILNMAYSTLHLDKSIEVVGDQLSDVCLRQGCSEESPLPVYIVCRRGNDSQKAVKLLKEKLPNIPVLLKDIQGGLHAWAKEVDPQFPVY